MTSRAFLSSNYGQWAVQHPSPDKSKASRGRPLREQRSLPKAVSLLAESVENGEWVVEIDEEYLL